MPAFAVATDPLFSLFSATSHAWWNEDWSKRKKIKLMNPAGEVANAPVLIRLLDITQLGLVTQKRVK